MEEQDKFKILNEIDGNIEDNTQFSEDELKILDIYSQDSDNLIRFEVAKILINFTDGQGEQILLRMIKDKDSLVRAEVCDSLRVSDSIETYNALKKVAESDKNGMVRGYAIFSMGDISRRIGFEKSTIVFLEDFLQREKVVFAIINSYKVLYDLGKKKYLNLLTDKINTKRYQNRCAAAHCLEEIMDDSNAEIIKSALLSRKAIEKAYAVISTIDEILGRVHVAKV